MDRQPLARQRSIRAEKSVAPLPTQVGPNQSVQFLQEQE
jgi:hypothetical protein